MPPVPDAGNIVAPTAQQTPQQFAASAMAASQASLQQYQSYLDSNMGRIDGTAISRQANAELAGMVSPIIQQYQSQLSTGTQAIGQYTNQLAGAFKGIAGQQNAAYTTAENQQSALDRAVSASLGNAGVAQAGHLNATLTQAGQDTSPAAQAARSAAGIAGANFASSSAGLGALYAQGAAQKAFGATLPAIGRLAGAQALGQLATGTTNAEAKALATAQEKYPTLVNNLVTQQLKAQGLTAQGLYNAARIDSTNAGTAERAAAADAANTTRISIANAANTTRTNIANASNATRVKLAKIKASEPGTLHTVKTSKGVFEVDSKTGAIVAKIPGRASTAAGAGGAQTTDSFATSARDLTKAIDQWGAGKGRYVKQTDGTSKFTYDENGQPVPYWQAVQQAITSGPKTQAWRQHAIQAVQANSHYQPGNNGRPYETLAQAMPNIAQNVAASIQNGHTANDVYKAFLATGVYPAKLQKQLLVTINRLYTQDYFKANPNASFLPSNVLVKS